MTGTNFKSCTILLWVVLILCCISAFSQTIQFTRFYPFVIPESQTNPVIFEANIQGSITNIYIQGYDNQNYVLNDNGINGDKIAGDNVYTVTLTPQFILGNFNEAVDVFRPFVGFIYLFNGAQQLGRYNLFAEIYTDAIPIVETCTYTYQNQSVIFAPNIMNIVTQNSVIDVVQVFEILNAFQFSRDIDFLNFILLPSQFENRHHVPLRNDVEGIGVTIFQNSILNNPLIPQKFKGYNFFPISGFFDGATNSYSHEIGHQWSSFLGNPYSNCAHWGFCSMANGTMGLDLTAANNCQGLEFQYELVAVPNSTLYQFQSINDFNPKFSDLDLYLIGLLPPESVNPFMVVNDQAKALSDYLNGQITNNQYAITTYTINDIILQFGSRNPVSVNATKDFKVLTIVLSPEVLNNEEIAFYNYFSKRAELKIPTEVHEGFSYTTDNPFYVNTRGLGTINTAFESLNGSCFSYCASTLFLTESSSQNITYKVADSLASTAIINAPHNVTYQSGQVISLLPNFTVKAGATFHAFIQDCAVETLKESNLRTEERTNKDELISDKDNALQDIDLHVFPNPFKLSTTIQLALSKSSPIQLYVYDLNGRLVQTLIPNTYYKAGSHQITWSRKPLESGVYILTFMTAQNKTIHKVLIL